MENEQSAMQQSYAYETASMRLQCLQIAVGSEQHPAGADDIVAAAQKFYDFVLGITPKA